LLLKHKPFGYQLKMADPAIVQVAKASAKGRKWCDCGGWRDVMAGTVCDYVDLI
jgi:hypothetical protein